MAAKWEEEKRLQALVASLKQTTVSEAHQPVLTGLIDRLEHTPTDVASVKWTTERLLEIISIMPETMDDKNSAFSQFCASLPKPEKDLEPEDWVLELLTDDQTTHQPRLKR